MSEIEKCTTNEEYLKRYKHAFDVHHASTLYKTGQAVLKNNPYAAWWQWRELARMLDGSYTLILPEAYLWAWIHSDSRFYSLAPIVCRSDKTKISYIPDERHGLEDRRVVTKIGRFLTANFAGRVMPERIAEIANIYAVHANPPRVHVARTSKEIAGIYSYGEGLKSCMAGKAWNLKENPVAAYNNEQGTFAAGVLYIHGPGGSPIARCVARFDTDPPQFGRIYGNEYAMRVALANEGYVAATEALHGCELTVKVMTTRAHSLAVPYLDAPSRYVLVNIPSGRMFATMARTSHVNALLAKHGLGDIDDGNNILLETGQYGYVQHDAFRWIGTKDYLTQTTLVCEYCQKRHSKSTLTTVHGGGKACQGCLRGQYVSALWNVAGDSRFIRIDSPELTCVSCVSGYVIRPLRPEEVYNVLWSNWMSDYIRVTDAVFSQINSDYIPKNEAFGYRPLHFDMMKVRSTPYAYAILSWVLANTPEVLVVEYNEKYPHLLAALWMDRDGTFRNLQRVQGDHSGEAKEPKTPWGSRLARFADWVHAQADKLSERELRNEDDPLGIQERFRDVARCTLGSVPLVQELRRARALRKLAGDAGSNATLQRSLDEDLDGRTYLEAGTRSRPFTSRR